MRFQGHSSGNATSMPRQLVSSVSAVIAQWRAARAVHPRGELFDAHVHLADRTSAVATALGGTGERAALVRLSTGAGVPGLLGVAVRVEVGGHVLDVLFTSGRRRLAPSRGRGGRSYTTPLPYAAAGYRVVLGLEPEEPQRSGGADPAAALPRAFTLTERQRSHPSVPIGRLVLQAARPGDPVAFDPNRNTHPDLQLASPLRRLRARAHAGSRRVRGAQAQELHRAPGRGG